MQWKFSGFIGIIEFETMSPTTSVDLQFLGVHNASVAKDSNCLAFGSEKQLQKLKLMQDLSRIKPQMIQKVLSSIGISEYTNVNLTHVNLQAEGFNGRSESSSHTEMLKLFPISTGTGSSFGSKPSVTENKITLPLAIGQNDPDSSRSVSAKALGQQAIAPLSIFYNGAVNVYDVPAEKAEEIMRLCSANSSSNTRTSTISGSKIEQISKPLSSMPGSNSVNEIQAQRPSVGLEIVRKLSLQRFLQKRTERFNRVAPYTKMTTAPLPAKAEEESDNQITLSLACSSQNF